MTARTYQAFLKKEGFLEITYVCPNENCGRVFLSQYKKYHTIYEYVSSTTGTILSREFSENIYNLTLVLLKYITKLYMRKVLIYHIFLVLVTEKL